MQPYNDEIVFICFVSQLTCYIKCKNDFASKLLPYSTESNEFLCRGKVDNTKPPKRKKFNKMQFLCANRNNNDLPVSHFKGIVAVELTIIRNQNGFKNV